VTKPWQRRLFAATFDYSNIQCNFRAHLMQL
jgi:hypothetical protein